MEFIIVFTLYSMIAFVTSFFFTSSLYKAELKVPIAWDPKQYTEEENLEKEATRRKICAQKAKNMGTWFAIFWAITIPLELLMQIIHWCNISVNAVAISKHDREFQNKVASVKAQKILDEYDAEQKAEFDKLVN